MVAQIDQLHVHVTAGPSLLENPSCRNIGKSRGSGGADDDGNAGFGTRSDLLYGGFPKETRLQAVRVTSQGGTSLKPDNHEDTAACDHISRMLARISDKWTLLVVRVLGHGPLRFNALRREVGEISQKVLASTLRELEQNGFVSRTVTPVSRHRVRILKSAWFTITNSKTA